MTLNEINIEGRVFGWSVSPMTRQNSFVGEGRLEVSSWLNDKGREALFYEFNVRWYGKDAHRLSKVPDGTMVKITGSLTEDIRVNGYKPDTARSKVYINIKKCEVKEWEDGYQVQ